MSLVVDLHTHSHYSRATSPNCTLEGLYTWGKIKGITIIGAGDFTHPDWLKELMEKLEPAEPGLYKLKSSIAKNLDDELPKSVKNNLIRFILTVEISNIYTKNNKVRKVHNLIIAPSFETVFRINKKLEKIGNLHADGRPILGIDSKQLLQISLDTDPDTLFIPAHIWTPWFGMFGSKSGFDSIQEAFEELTPYIYAIETGLSSDPFMNWNVPELQNISITSHSDAHSPQKLGREATVMNAKIDYSDIVNGIKTNDDRLVGTIEFFPQEGKYHLDGHRVCGVRFTPQETREHGGICPKCKRPLTVGVNYRVQQLSGKPSTFQTHKTVEYIVPLIELVSEIKGKGVGSKTVVSEYETIYSTLGDEFSILRKISPQDIKNNGFEDLAIVIDRMRKKDVIIEPGYDGVYGKVNVFRENQMSLLSVG
jgi:uncharacterized protein (TIGR00375 family)